MNIEFFLSRYYWGNSVQSYLTTAAIIFIGWLLLFFFSKVVLRKLEKLTLKTKIAFDDFIVQAIAQSVVPFLYIAIVYAAVHTLALNPKISRLIDNIWVVVFTFFAIRLIVSFIKYLILSYIKKKFPDSDRRNEMRGLLIVVSFTLWSIGLVFLLDNLGYDVATVITGLGIGGIAVALAAQTILGDLFSYFVIFFDRPFEVGDFIIVDDKMGTVEYIGIKTTRVRSLGGEQIIFANKNLTDSRVHNYKRMDRRRVVFGFGVEYDTSGDLLAEIPPIVKGIIERYDDTTFDRAHFSAFGDSSLNFEVVYYIETGDYNKYMDRQQAINLALLNIMRDKKISFAFPTQTLYLHSINGMTHNNEIKLND